MKCALSTFLLCFTIIVTKAQKKYNVLWLVVEDQSSQFFPMYGDTTISLPALEALAAESTIYDNAFANVPVCAPARSTIILGMYVTKTGTHNMRTYASGRKQTEPTIDLDAYTPVMPEGTMEFPKYLRADGYYCTNNHKRDYNMKITDAVWDESSKKAHWRNRAKGQQFFSIFNFTDCHESGIWKFSKDSLFVDPSDVNVPPYFPDDSIIRHDLAVNYSNLKRVDDQIAAIIQQLKDDGLYDDTYIFFYGDHGGPLPRHKRSLNDTGLKVPFFVKMPKGLGGEMLRSEEMISFLDLAPTMLSIVGIEKPENMQGRAFLGQFVGDPVDYVFASSDRFDAIYDRSRAVRSKRYKYIRNYRADLPYAIPVGYRFQVPMMNRWLELNQDGKLSGPSKLWMRSKKEPEEFFDLVRDPFELNNLIDNKFYFREIAIHKQEMDQWMKENDDQGGYDEQELIQKWKKMALATNLKAPTRTVKNGKVTIGNPNSYGNIVYKVSGDDSWHPLSAHRTMASRAVYKVVHIGLADSAEVEL